MNCRSYLSIFLPKNEKEGVKVVDKFCPKVQIKAVDDAHRLWRPVRRRRKAKIEQSCTEADPGECLVEKVAIDGHHQYVVDEHGSAQLQRRLSPHQTTAKDDNGNVGGGEGEQLPRATGHQPKVHCSRVTGAVPVLRGAQLHEKVAATISSIAVHTVQCQARGACSNHRFSAQHCRHFEGEEVVGLTKVEAQVDVLGESTKRLLLLLKMIVKSSC